MLYQTKSYFRYLKKAKGAHGVHSPFVFDLMRQVFDTKDRFYAFEAIELIRKQLILDNRKIEINDLGAGSKKGNNKTKTISKIVKSASKPPKYGQLLFRLANYSQVTNALEIGTSLGISTAYLAKARKTAEITTLEGDSNIARIAEENFKKLKLNNVTLIKGNFDNTLPLFLKDKKKLDFVFFDGNHTQKSTLNYFNQCLSKTHNNTIFVFDDIYWSEGMTKAWEDIKTDNRVTTTIDIFQMGIVFFRKELPKQHLVIKY